MIYEMGLKFDKLMETLFGLEVPEYPIFPPTISGRHWRTFAEYVERNATHPDRGDPSAMLLRHDIPGLTKHEAREMNWQIAQFFRITMQERRGYTITWDRYHWRYVVGGIVPPPMVECISHEIATLRNWADQLDAIPRWRKRWWRIPATPQESVELPEIG